MSVRFEVMHHIRPPNAWLSRGVEAPSFSDPTPGGHQSQFAGANESSLNGKAIICLSFASFSKSPRGRFGTEQLWTGGLLRLLPRGSAFGPRQGYTAGVNLMKEHPLAIKRPRVGEGLGVPQLWIG